MMLTKQGSVKEMKYLSRIIHLVVASAVCFFTFFHSKRRSET